MSNYTKKDGAMDFIFMAILIIVISFGIAKQNNEIKSKIDKLESKIDSINLLKE